MPKKYCACFALGKYCQGCDCKGCLNTQKENNNNNTIYQDDIADLIREKIKDIPAKDMILVDLVGYHTVETEINIPFFTELLGGSYFLFKIKCHSKPLINVEDYKGNISLKGEFLDLVEGSDLSDEDKKKVMLLGIQALSGVKVGELSI